MSGLAHLFAQGFLVFFPMLEVLSLSAMTVREGKMSKRSFMAG